MDLREAIRTTGSVRDVHRRTGRRRARVERCSTTPASRPPAATASRGASCSSRTRRSAASWRRSDAAGVGRVRRRRRAPGTAPFNAVVLPTAAPSECTRPTRCSTTSSRSRSCWSSPPTCAGSSAMDAELDRVRSFRRRRSIRSAGTCCSAARDRGLGGVHRPRSCRGSSPRRRRCSKLPDHHALAATIFLGLPGASADSSCGATPVEAFASVDSFEGVPLV